MAHKPKKAKCCETCKHSADYGESVVFIACERKARRKYIEKAHMCEHYESREATDHEGEE